MASLQQADFLARLKALLPASWFSDTANVLDGYVSGFANVGVTVWNWLEFALAQTRLATASGHFLDLIAWDFFGARFRRRASQSDDAFRAAIVTEMLRPRTTREGMATALKHLTGYEPIIFEPANPNDCGAWSGPMMGYSIAGRYGSLAMPYQCLVDVQRPLGAGIPGVEGWGGEIAGYGVGAGEYVNPSMVSGAVTDAMIYDTIEDTRAAGTICFTRIGDTAVPADLACPYTFLADENGNYVTAPDGMFIVVSGPV